MSDAVSATFDVLRSAASDSDIDPDEQVQSLIEEFGWPAVCAGIFAALESNDSAIWDPAAAAIWGAILDKREMDAPRAVALVYFRLHTDKSSYEDKNLAWSIASTLKGEGYLSSYDPRLDPPIKEQLQRLRAG
jgi:hypothetical protein